MKAKGQPRAAKERGPNRPRQWKENNRWSCSYNTDAEIMAFVCADLADLNKKAGMTSLPPRQYNHKATQARQDLRRLDVMQQLDYQSGSHHSAALLCPLVERCGCPCEARIEETPGQCILFKNHPEHTAAGRQLLIPFR